MSSKQIDAESLNEEFYQVTPDILESFPKFRLPLNLYRFKEDIGQLQPYYYADRRLDQNMQKDLHNYSRKGQIFVARSDHKIYAKHISKQLDLVLQDRNLTTEEVVYIIRFALTEKASDFFEQPVPAAMEKLKKDSLVLTQYLWEDRSRLENLLKMLHQEYSWARLCYNSTILGLALFMKMQEDSLKRRAMDNLALGLLTHMLGMTKVPAFILEKKTRLSREEQDKITNYPMTGANIMRKLDVLEDVALNCHLEHKELLDGSGVPRGLKGAEISLHGRLAALVHAFCEYSLRPDAKGQDLSRVAECLAQAQNKYDAKLSSSLQELVPQVQVAPD
ncbi:putative metal dependent phosphohydrolase [Desulfonatronospira thiodismutans ASO3-1]|uniref:Metal dependent phosphohydrolase n=1 Tax=Desulfonatronospira thiodismutans ASO3-1 TaxID=555779 RepID=D6SUH0_9BACT|nr:MULTISPECIES: HD domain-containing phosphohydrolase [Desulfonatronospira]EFI32950.1 putative metal dependent phosphohydrolase [Desulfonatronospira thiodismutans ASO3-1]RQD76465.1 MAG: HD family phosphohydrolase [Desulfonatronospira sp. MSAO_Bac3]